MSEVEQGKPRPIMGILLPALVSMIPAVIIFTAQAIIWVTLQGETDRRQDERITELEGFRDAGGRFTLENANERIGPLEINIAVVANDIAQIKEMLRDMRDETRRTD